MLDNDWDDFGYYDDKDAAVIIEENSFVAGVDLLDDRISYQPYHDDLILKHFDNRLIFADESLNEYYQSLENRWRLTLVEAAQLICKRRKLGVFTKLLTFKVMNLSNGEHPDMVGIYAPNGEKGLLPVEIEIDEEFDIWLRIGQGGFYIFLTDEKNKGDFYKSFAIEKPLHYIDFADILAFGFEENSYGKAELYISLKSGRFITIRAAHTGAEGALVADLNIAKHIRSALQEYAQTKELPVKEMPSPDDRKAFNKWLEVLEKLQIEFGWRDLEIAVSAHGIQAATAFLPSLKEANKYYKVIHKVGAELLARAGMFAEALISLQKSGKDFRESEWETELVSFLRIMKKLKYFFLVVDFGFIIYWLITLLKLIPNEYLFKDYCNPILVAWNWSFLPLDLFISGTGLTSLWLWKANNKNWKSLALISLVLTFCSGLQAIAFWILSSDFDISWWIPNLFLFLYPLFFIPKIVTTEAEKKI